MLYPWEKAKGLWGFRDEYSNVVIEPKFRYATEFSEGLAGVVGEEGFFGYVDETGEWAIKPQFDVGLKFDKGIAKVKVNDKYGLINKKGEWVFKPILDEILSNGFDIVPAKIEKRWGYLNKQTGTWVAEPQFSMLFLFKDGKGNGYKPNGVYCQVDSDGKITVID